MAPLKLLTVVSSSFLFMAKAIDNPEPTQPTYSVALGMFPRKDGQCLAEVNAARAAAGFSEFAQAVDPTNRLPKEGSPPEEGEPEWAWKPVCEALIPSGTYAYLPIDNADAVDCNAVVDKWKGAYSNFDELPPPNKDQEELYKKQENVSFVALYNPTKNASADCRVVTCTKTTPAAASAQGTGTQGQSSEEKASALICMTVPDVLTDGEKAPFTEEQWGQIVAALEGSASAVAPGVVGLALAFLGLSML
ncbi:SAG family member [Eimeria mitis]|uniref:SAG family member n=1 Tax=Eimeria mitis TaxID=44415 RepID=U6K6S9_9EIME|nr:SAG family member [Eimeria mitis]CDJ32536.1 SAG family member [Eimeria mitis]